MFFWNKFCGIIIFFFILINGSYAQYQLKAFPFPKKNSLKNLFLPCQTLLSIHSENSFSNKKCASELNSKKMVPGGKNFHAAFFSDIPENLATCDYGFFCRQEIKVEKLTNIPIRLRLGSLEECNYYEGKH